MSSIKVILSKDRAIPNSFTRFIRNFIFPPTSEKEVFMLVVLASLFCLTNRDLVIYFIHNHFVQDSTSSIRPLLFSGLAILFGIYAIFMLIYNVLSNRIMSQGEKIILGGFFYGFLSLFSLYSVLASFDGKLQTFDFYLSLYILIRSALTLFGLFITVRSNKESFYAQQFNDTQVKLYELPIIIAGSIVLYFYFLPTKPAVTDVTISYFYLTIILIVLNSLHSIITRGKSVQNTPEIPANPSKTI